MLISLQGKAATMGLTAGQVPEYGHTKVVPEGIEGLEASFDNTIHQ